MQDDFVLKTDETMTQTGIDTIFFIIFCIKEALGGVFSYGTLRDIGIYHYVEEWWWLRGRQAYRDEKLGLAIENACSTEDDYYRPLEVWAIILLHIADVSRIHLFQHWNSAKVIVRVLNCTSKVFKIAGRRLCLPPFKDEYIGNSFVVQQILGLWRSPKYSGKIRQVVTGIELKCLTEGLPEIWPGFKNPVITCCVPGKPVEKELLFRVMEHVKLNKQITGALVFCMRDEYPGETRIKLCRKMPGGSKIPKIVIDFRIIRTYYGCEERNAVEVFLWNGETFSYPIRFPPKYYRHIATICLFEEVNFLNTVDDLDIQNTMEFLCSPPKRRRISPPSPDLAHLSELESDEDTTILGDDPDDDDDDDE
jgi:hypothetical protein